MFRVRLGKMASALLTIIIGLLIVYSTLGWVLYFMQPSLLYKPTREIPYTPEEIGLDYEDVVFGSEDGLKLNGWYVGSKDHGMTILFCHGNGGNIAHRLDSINIFYEMGLNCFVFDYRGYGNSEGKPNEEGTYLDAMAAYKWLTDTKKVSPDKIIIFGRSLGGSVAAYLAGKVPAKGLVVESAFTSYADIGKRFYPYLPVRWFASYKYSTIEYVKNVRCPVMIIHSRTDELVPFEFGLEIYDASNEPKEFVEIVGNHNDGFLVSNSVYKNAWSKWVKHLKNPQSKADSQQAS